MDRAMVTVDNVTRSFALPKGGTYIALKDINLNIAEGEFISLIGHSGCGKSTLLNLMAGLDQAVAEAAGAYRATAMHAARARRTTSPAPAVFSSSVKMDRSLKAYHGPTPAPLT